MAENQSETVLIYRVDEASVSKAEARIASLRKQQEAFSAALLKGDISAEQFANGMDKAGKEIAQLERALDRVGKEAKETASAEQLVAKELDKIKRAGDIDKVVASAIRLKKETKDADKAAQQLAADLKKVGANADEIGGATRGFAQGAQGGGFDLGQFGRNLKSAPAIPIGVGGLTTEPISKALIAIDGLGISISQLGVGAVVAAPFVIALAFAVSKLMQDIEKNITAIEAAVETVRSVEQFIGEGATTEDVKKRIEELNIARQAEANVLATTQKAGEQFAESGWWDFATRLRPDFQAFNTEVDKSKDIINGYDLEIRKLTEAQDAGRIAANDAAQAERDLAAERTKGIINAAQQAGELESARQQTNEKSKEELQALIEAEANHTRQLQTQLDVYKASGDTTKEITDKIADLERQIDTSAQKSDIFKNAMGSAQTQAQKSAAAQIESAKASKQVAIEVAKMTGGLGAASSGLAVLGSSIGKITEQVKKPTSIIGIGKRPAAAIARDKELEKAAQDYQKKLSDINRDLIENFNDIGLGLQDALTDLNIDTGRKIRDALSEGAFLSVRDIQRDAKDDRADLEREAARDRRDAQMKANQELLDLQAEFLRAQVGQLQGAINSIRGGKTASSQGSFVTVAPR